MSEFGVFVQQNLMLFGIAFALVFFILIIEIRRFTKNYKEIEPGEMVKLLNQEKAVLLDVRELSERDSGHVRSSRHMPASTFADQISSLKAKRDVPVVAYCSTGMKSGKACALLHKSGFSQVYSLKGGFAAWQQAHLPVVKKK